MELELTQLSEVKVSSLTQPNNSNEIFHNFPPQQKPQHLPSITYPNPNFTGSSNPFGMVFLNSHLNDKLSPNPFLFDNGAASDNANKDYHLDHVGNVNHERRLRRKISNRESARRSRLRKKQQINELQMEVHQLRGVNNNLSEKLISLLEGNHQILQENAHLKEKVSSLQVIMTNIFARSRNVEEVAGIFKSEA